MDIMEAAIIGGLIFLLYVCIRTMSRMRVKTAKEEEKWRTDE